VFRLRSSNFVNPRTRNGRCSFTCGLRGFACVFRVGLAGPLTSTTPFFIAPENINSFLRMHNWSEIMASYICKIEDLGGFIDQMKEFVKGTKGYFDYKEGVATQLNENEYSRINWYFYNDNDEGNTIRLYDSEFQKDFCKLYVEHKNYVILRGHNLGKAHETLKQKFRDLLENIKKPPPGVNTKHPGKCLSYFEEERNNGSMENENRQNKCWRYSRNPDDKNDKDWYIFAFVNTSESCSLTRFEAADGKHIEMIYKRGNFQNNFPEYLIPASFPLRLSHQPSLVKARKEGLPIWAISEIRKQVIELATSSLSALLGCC